MMPVKRSKFGAAGFTLIEILIVISLLSAVSLAVTASLIQGLRVFNRFNLVLDGEGKAFLMEKLTRDLKNSVPYSLVPWKITRDSLSFASVPFEAGEGRESFAGMPSHIIYQWDYDRKEIVRIQNDFPFNSAVFKKEVLAGHVQSLKFDVARENEEAPPTRITVLIEDGDPLKPQLLKKEILIPCGYREARNK